MWHMGVTDTIRCMDEKIVEKVVELVSTPKACLVRGDSTDLLPSSRGTSDDYVMCKESACQRRIFYVRHTAASY